MPCAPSTSFSQWVDLDPVNWASGEFGVNRLGHVFTLSSVFLTIEAFPLTECRGLGCENMANCSVLWAVWHLLLSMSPLCVLCGLDTLSIWTRFTRVDKSACFFQQIVPTTTFSHSVLVTWSGQSKSQYDNRSSQNNTSNSHCACYTKAHWSCATLHLL